MCVCVVIVNRLGWSNEQQMILKGSQALFTLSLMVIKILFFYFIYLFGDEGTYTSTTTNLPMKMSNPPRYVMKISKLQRQCYVTIRLYRLFTY